MTYEDSVALHEATRNAAVWGENRDLLDYLPRGVFQSVITVTAIFRQEGPILLRWILRSSLSAAQGFLALESPE